MSRLFNFNRYPWAKLLLNPDFLRDLRKGKIYPLSIQLALTGNCQLDCSYCSFGQKYNIHIPPNEVKKLFHSFYLMGGRVVELTGGEPLLYPYLAEIISFSCDIGLKVGLKTNGINLKLILSPEDVSKLSWIRVSLNTLEQGYPLDLLGVDDLCDISLSYVFHSGSTLVSFKEMRIRVDPEKKLKCRVVMDHNSTPEEFLDFDAFSGGIYLDFQSDLENVEFQSRVYGMPSKCWVPWLKPYVAPDGNVYKCCMSKGVICTVEEFYTLGFVKNGPLVPFDTEGCDPGKCYLKGLSDAVDYVIRGDKYGEFI